MIDPRGKQQRQPHLRAAGDIDLVDANPVLAEHPQTGPGFFQHGPRDRVVSADVAINLADRHQGVGLREWPPRGDNLPASVGQSLMMLAGRVLKRRGGNEDAGHSGLYGKKLKGTAQCNVVFQPAKGGESASG